MFQPTPDIQFFADLTGSRDVPDFIDLTQGFFPPRSSGAPSFTPLASQKAWTGEIGSRGKWDRFAWDVTYLSLRAAGRAAEVQHQSGRRHSGDDLQRQAHHASGRRIRRQRRSLARSYRRRASAMC